MLPGQHDMGITWNGVFNILHVETEFRLSWFDGFSCVIANTCIVNWTTAFFSRKMCQWCEICLIAVSNQRVGTNACRWGFDEILRYHADTNSQSPYKLQLHILHFTHNHIHDMSTAQSRSMMSTLLPWTRLCGGESAPPPLFKLKGSCFLEQRYHLNLPWFLASWGNGVQWKVPWTWASLVWCWEDTGHRCLLHCLGKVGG